MLNHLLVYSLAVYFGFYVANHSEFPLAVVVRTRLIAHFPNWLAYSTECALCSTWWLTFGLACFGRVPPLYAVTAPVLVLFQDLVYCRLRPVPAPSHTSTTP